jgi:YVTN family beta-propeller protein
LKNIFISPLLLAFLLLAGSCNRGLLESTTEPGRPVYVLNQYQPSISVIDGEKDELVRHVKLPDVTSTFSVNSKRNLVLAVTGFGDAFAPYKSEIHEITPDGRENRESFKIKHIPDDMYLSDDGTTALVVHNTVRPGWIIPLSVIDLKKRAAIKTFETKGFVTGADYEDGSFVLYMVGTGDLSNRDGDLGVFRIDLKDLTLTMISNQGDMFRSVIFKEGKAYGILVHNPYSIPNNNTLQVIDLKTNLVEKMLQLSERPFEMAFVGDLLYVTHFAFMSPLTRNDNRVSIINTNTYEIEDVIEVGRGPASICYSPSLGKAYTANDTDSSVSVIDTRVRKVIKTIPINQRGTLLVRCPK